MEIWRHLVSRKFSHAGLPTYIKSVTQDIRPNEYTGL